MSIVFISWGRKLLLIYTIIHNKLYLYMNCNSRSNNSSSKTLFTIEIILKLFSDNSACNVANTLYVLYLEIFDKWVQSASHLQPLPGGYTGYISWFSTWCLTFYWLLRHLNHIIILSLRLQVSCTWDSASLVPTTHNHTFLLQLV